MAIGRISSDKSLSIVGEFIEDDKVCIDENGNFHSNEFIEQDDIFSIKKDEDGLLNVHCNEIIEVDLLE